MQQSQAWTDTEVSRIVTLLRQQGGRLDALRGDLGAIERAQGPAKARHLGLFLEMVAEILALEQEERTMLDRVAALERQHQQQRPDRPLHPEARPLADEMSETQQILRQKLSALDVVLLWWLLRGGKGPPPLNH